MISTLISPRRIACLLLLLPILLILAGCGLEDADDNGPPVFSVQFSGIRLADEDWWVVLHDRTGNEVLAVQQVPESDGFVDFGEVPESRLSCTFVRRYGSNFELESFIDVPGGHWLFDKTSPDGIENMGETDVTLLYPPGPYTNELLWLPDYSLPGNGVPTSGQHTLYPEFFGLDRDRFTAFAQVQNFGEGYCGEIIRAPYSYSHTNEYLIELSTPIVWHPVATTRPATEFTLAAWRDEAYFPEIEVDAWMFQDGMHWQLPVCDYSVDGYDLYAHALGTDYGWTYMRRGTGLPEVLEIPSSGISGTYNPALQQFENVAVQGVADYIEAGFLAETDISHGRWFVQAKAYSRVLRLPALPDSLVSAWGLPLDDFSGWSLSGFDYSDLGSQDGEIRRRFKSPQSVIPTFDRMYAFYTLFNDAAASKAPPSRPKATDLRANHFRCW